MYVFPQRNMSKFFSASAISATVSKAFWSQLYLKEKPLQHNSLNLGLLCVLYLQDLKNPKYRVPVPKITDPLPPADSCPITGTSGADKHCSCAVVVGLLCVVIGVLKWMTTLCHVAGYRLQDYTYITGDLHQTHLLEPITDGVCDFHAVVNGIFTSGLF